MKDYKCWMRFEDGILLRFFLKFDFILLGLEVVVEIVVVMVVVFMVF